MLDVFHIPSNTDSTKIFYATGGTNDWQTWQKPRGAKFIQIFCLGAGAAGGSGAVSTGTVSGGAGGNTGGLVKATFPAILIPDTLFIQVGLGGIGNITGTGGSGGISYVSIAPTGSIALPQTLVVASSTTVGLGGTGGSGTGANPPSAPTATTTAVAPFLSLGIFTALAGVQGGSALVGAAGTNINALGSTIVTGGAGGGGKTNIAQFDGGSILSASVILTSNVNGGASGTNAGGNGYGTSLYNSAICGTGGAGGGGQVSGTGGAGGKGGWYGCGGGGSGASSASPRARGGDGGDGLVIITTIT